jgi:hypothetical protein
VQAQQAVIAKNESPESEANARQLAEFFLADGTLKSAQQELWCQYWVTGFDEMTACVEAGYADGLASNPSYHKTLRASHMRKPHIQLRVRNLVKERVAHLGIDENWIILNVVKVMNQSIAGTEVLDREGKPTGQWQHDSRGALQALQMLGTNIGMFQKKEKTREVHLNLNFGDSQTTKVRVELETGFSEAHDVIDVVPMSLD